MPIIYLQFQRSKVISCGTNREKQSLEGLKVLNLFLVHTLLLQLTAMNRLTKHNFTNFLISLTNNSNNNYY